MVWIATKSIQLPREYNTILPINSLSCYPEPLRPVQYSKSGNCNSIKLSETENKSVPFIYINVNL